MALHPLPHVFGPHVGVIEPLMWKLEFGVNVATICCPKTDAEATVHISIVLSGVDKLQQSITSLLEDAAKQLAAAGIKAVIALI